MRFWRRVCSVCWHDQHTLALQLLAGVVLGALVVILLRSFGVILTVAYLVMALSFAALAKRCWRRA
jgi:uncharacterized membrane protein YagU involved in acid resistance